MSEVNEEECPTSPFQDRPNESPFLTDGSK